MIENVSLLLQKTLHDD